jgi:hypothetical protein
MYQLVYGRDPSEEEARLAIDYLHAEPLREYEEIKKKADEKPAGGEGRKGKGPKSAEAAAASGGSEAAPVAAKETPAEAAVPEADPAATTESKSATAAEEKAAMGMGMMEGVPGMGRRGNNPAAAPEVKYDPTAWGRYAKILLSSSEFLFVD